MRSLLLFILFGFAACQPQQITRRDVLGVTSGGLGESWLVLEETTGRSNEDYVDDNRYVVYHCLHTGCVPVSSLKGSEQRDIPRAPHKSIKSK